MNDADREILVAEIDNPRVLVQNGFCLFASADKIDALFSDVGCGSRFRLPGLGEYKRQTKN
jgi:hypothetical protein